MTTSHKLRLIILCLVVGCTVGCDQVTKHFARTGLSQLGSVAILHGFGELRLAENAGSFLSLGDSLPRTFRVALFTFGVGLLLIILAVYLVRRSSLGWMPYVGLAVVLAGGASNLIDRITQRGFVTDFIFLEVGPLHTGVFNVADLMIMIGGVVFALYALKHATASPIQNQER